MILRKTHVVAIALIFIVGLSAIASAQPEFVLTGVDDNGDGTFTANYTLNNVNGSAATWDVQGKYGWEHGGILREGYPSVGRLTINWDIPTGLPVSRATLSRSDPN